MKCYSKSKIRRRKTNKCGLPFDVRKIYFIESKSRKLKLNIKKEKKV